MAWQREQVRATGAQIDGSFTYQKGVTRFDSATEDFLKLGGRRVQDFTHLMSGMLHLMGIPCRYVSGSLHLATKRAEPAQSHAWIEFWSPASSWVPYANPGTIAPPVNGSARGRGSHRDSRPR